MQLSQRHVDIVEALYGLNIELARGSDEQRRELTKKIDEQICHEFGKRWGMKARAFGTIDNASKDSIAYLEDDGTVSVWDWQNGTTREPQIRAGKEPDYPHLPTSEAKFIEVQPVNHLSSVPDNGDDDDDDDALIELLKQILDTQKTILENQTRLAQAINLLIDKPTPEIPPIKFPEYKASTFFGTITLKPQV